MAEPELIYKITVLELLNKAEISLSNSQICDFFQEYDYTNYFIVQKVIYNLLDTGMIESRSDHNTTIYEVTDKGSETLRVLRDKVTPAIEADIKGFLKSNGSEIREENSLTANYDAVVGGGYSVHLKYEQSGKVIMDLVINVPQKEQADRMCNNWKEKYMDLYSSFMDDLLV